MRNSSELLEIKEIMLLTSNNEITLFGTANRNLMRFETQITIDSTQLNIVINQLQKNNSEIEVSELFQSRSTENGQLLFYLDGIMLHNAFIDLGVLQQNKIIRQIRA